MNQETINKYKQVIAATEDVANHAGCIDGYYEPMNNTVGTVHCIQDLKDIVELWESNQWISVEDRLPENHVDVYLFSPDGYEVGRLNGRRFSVNGCTATNITHWKPTNPPQDK